MPPVLASLSRHLLAAALGSLALVMPAAAGPAEPLVTPQWLHEQKPNPDLVVLDIRSAIDGGGMEAYVKAHIPGAVHSDYDKAGWRVTRNSVPFMLPTAAELEKLIGETGIDEDSRVVIVPAGVSATDFGSAARVYWTLRAAGHPAVSILDGGFAAWQAAGYPVESGKVAISPKIFTANMDSSLLASIEDVESARAQASRKMLTAKLGTSLLTDVKPVERRIGAALVDARPASYFEGREKAPAAKAYGHIEGAVHLDSAAFYDPATNRLRPREQLAAIAATLPEGPVIAYCNTGHWAATDWFVLSVVLVRPDVRLYDGSMVEWTADARRPVASSRTRWDDLKKVLGFGL